MRKNIRRSVIVKGKRFSIALLAFLLVFNAARMAGKAPHRAEQMQFSVEGEMEKPAAIPPDVLAILSADEYVRSHLESEEPPRKTAPVSWFSASRIHLTSNPRQTDLIVKGEWPLMGANVGTFWVFLSTPRGHRLVLTGPAHNLEVKTTFWNKHREIELISMTAAEIHTILCRFDGKQYKQQTPKWSPIE
jgi:hypothetical protein